MSQYSPFDYVKSINESKDQLMDSPDEMWEKKYSPFIVNKALYPFPDTVLLVNEMNQCHYLDNRLQFDFLLNSIRPRKRYAPWLKASKIDNLELAKFIAKTQGKDLKYEMVDFHSQRPGHDLRYSLDGSKMAKMGWTPKSAYEQLETTIKWTLDNDRWLSI